MEDAVAIGVELLDRMSGEEVSVAEAVDRLESVTTHPEKTRRILDEAEARGIIERESGRVRPRGGGHVDFEKDVIQKEGEFTCRRCGSSITTGYFLNLDSGEFGAFGSSCIRKVTGRE